MRIKGKREYHSLGLRGKGLNVVGEKRRDCLNKKGKKGRFHRWGRGPF